MLDRIVEVYNFKEKKWIEISYKNLKSGDLFRFFDGDKRYKSTIDNSNAWVIDGEPYENENGIGECKIAKSFIEIDNNE